MNPSGPTASAKRLVSCAPSITDLLLMLGLEAAIVGADERSHQFCPLHPRVEDIGPVDNLNVPKIKELQPDRVLALDSVAGSEAVIGWLREEDLPLTVLHSERFDDLLVDAYMIGAECGVEERARKLVTDLEARIRRIGAAAGRGGDPPRVYFELYPDPFVSPGARNWITDMLKRAGAQNIFHDFPLPTFLPEEEEILKRDPEMIFIGWVGQGDELDDLDPDDILKRAGWQGLSAVKTKQVHFLPESLFAFPGPRMLEGLELLISYLGGMD